MAIFTDGPGDDTFTGTSDDDLFKLTRGGNDTANGEAGDDLFRFGAAFDAGDRIDGGTGTDSAWLDGNYSGVDAVSFDAQTMVGVEIIGLVAGHSYGLATDDATVGAGETLAVKAWQLGAANTISFDGSAETDGTFAFLGGAGNDVLIGGAQGDSFNLRYGGDDSVAGGEGDDRFILGANLSDSDIIQGGGGTDSAWLDGDYSGIGAVSFDAQTMTGVEIIGLAAAHSYELATDDATVDVGETLAIKAWKLGAADALSFDGSAETDGSFAFLGGAGNDVLIGGAQGDSFNLRYGGDDSVAGGEGDDQFILGANLTNSDVIQGGGGYDTVVLDGDYGDPVASTTFILTAGTLNGIEALRLVGDHGYFLVFDDGDLAAGQRLKVDVSAVTFATNPIVEGTSESDGAFDFVVGPGTARLFGGGGNDTFNMSRAADFTSTNGNGGDDTFNFAANYSLGLGHVDGGGGNNRVNFNGDYTFLFLRQAHIERIQTFAFRGGHSYTGVALQQDLSFGATLTLDAGASSLFQVDLSSGTAPSYIVKGGTGDDSFTFGSNFHATDQVNGGAGSDTVELNGDYSGGLTFGVTTLTNVEMLKVDSGHDYKLTSSDATVAAGQLLTVDASALVLDGDGDAAIDFIDFDGSAETNGMFDFTGGAGNDTFTGGAGADSLTGGGGSDSMNGGGGADTFVYSAASQSTSTVRDFIAGFDALVDRLDFDFGVTAVQPTLNAAIDAATFDSDLQTSYAAFLAAMGRTVNSPSVPTATVINATGGDLAGHSFLLVDANGLTGYNPGSDYVIDITGYSGTVTVSTFI